MWQSQIMEKTSLEVCHHISASTWSFDMIFSLTESSWHDKYIFVVFYFRFSLLTNENNENKNQRKISTSTVLHTAACTPNVFNGLHVNLILFFLKMQTVLCLRWLILKFIYALIIIYAWETSPALATIA